MDNPTKILIIQLKRAGDVIVTLPAAAMLKHRFPQARIDFMTDKAFAPLLENNPAIDRVVAYDRRAVRVTIQRIRAELYDSIFDFQSSPRSALLCLGSRAKQTAGYRVPVWGRAFTHTVRRPGSGLTVTEGKLTLLEAVLGPLGAIPEPRVILTEAEKGWANSAGPRTAGSIVGLIPTHRRASRKWHAKSFIELGQKLEQAGHAIWLFWGPDERPEVEAIQRRLPTAWMIPETSLRQMAALLARCELVVTNDNGPKHLAVAVGVPTLTIFGPTDPLAWGASGPRHKTLQATGLRCLGCNLNACPFNHECMTQVTPDSVFSASRDLLSKSLGPVSV
jgi:heptosyltransferase-3